jgi:TolB-like protein
MILKNYIINLCILISLAGISINTSVCYGTLIDAKRIAVLELINHAELPKEEVDIITDTVRGKIAELLGNRFTMITKGNILVLIDQQTCNQASEASCEVEMGQKLGAHYIITGTLTRLETKVYLTLKLYA